MRLHTPIASARPSLPLAPVRAPHIRPSIRAVARPPLRGAVRQRVSPHLSRLPQLPAASSRPQPQQYVRPEADASLHTSEAPLSIPLLRETLLSFASIQHLHWNAFSALEALHVSVTDQARKPPLSWPALIKQLTACCCCDAVAVPALGDAVRSKMLQLHQLRPLSFDEAAQVLIATALLGIPLTSQDTTSLLRCVASALDHSWVPQHLSADRVPAILGAYAWHVKQVSQQHSAVSQEPENIASPHYSAADATSASLLFGSDSLKPAASSQDGIVNIWARRAFIARALGETASSYYWGLQYMMDSWGSGHTSINTWSSPLGRLLQSITALESLQWPELWCALASGEVSVGTACGKLSYALQAMSVARSPHTSTAEGPQPVHVIQALCALAGWCVRAGRATAGSTLSLALRQAACTYVGWGGVPESAEVGGVKEGVTLLSAIVSLDVPVEPAVLSKLVHIVTAQLEQEPSTYGAEHLGGLSWSLSRLLNGGLSSCLAAELDEHVWCQVLEQSAQHARTASTSQLRPVVELFAHPSCRESLATASCLTKSITVPTQPHNTLQHSSTNNSSDTSANSTVWAELLTACLRVANQVAVSCYHVPTTSSSTSSASHKGLLALIARIVASVDSACERNDGLTVPSRWVMGIAEATAALEQAQQVPGLAGLLIHTKGCLSKLQCGGEGGGSEMWRQLGRLNARAAACEKTEGAEEEQSTEGKESKGSDSEEGTEECEDEWEEGESEGSDEDECGVQTGWHSSSSSGSEWEDEEVEIEQVKPPKYMTAPVLFVLLAQDLPAIPGNTSTGIETLTAAAHAHLPPQCPFPACLAAELLQVARYSLTEDFSTAEAAEAQFVLNTYVPHMPDAALTIPVLLGILTSAALLRIKLGPAAHVKLSAQVQRHLTSLPTQPLSHLHAGSGISQGEAAAMIWGLSECQQTLTKAAIASVLNIIDPKEEELEHSMHSTAGGEGSSTHTDEQQQAEGTESTAANEEQASEDEEPYLPAPAAVRRQLLSVALSLFVIQSAEITPDVWFLEQAVHELEGVVRFCEENYEELDLAVFWHAMQQCALQLEAITKYERNVAEGDDEFCTFEELRAWSWSVLRRVIALD